jgi:SAM-dependent methyltransferase
MGEWFKDWFGKDYLDLYPHRDEREAEQMVDLIVKTLPDSGPILDICCGAGRHAKAFRGRGCFTTGVDLSRHLLELARDLTSTPVVQADIRALPIRSRSIGLAVNLFTSFGYFDRDTDHRLAITEAFRVLRPGGWFVMDFLNAKLVREGLVPSESKIVGDETLSIERRLEDDGRYVVKTIRWPTGRRHLERVRLFSSDELEELFRQAGGQVRHRFGSYQGHSLGPRSPRVILMATAEPC